YHMLVHTLCSLPPHTPSTARLHTLSLHDALPICPGHIAPRHRDECHRGLHRGGQQRQVEHPGRERGSQQWFGGPVDEQAQQRERSEEHTSELQSRFDLVCRLLLEKKKKQQVTDIQ